MNQKTIITIAAILIVAVGIVLVIFRTGDDPGPETTTFYCGANKSNPVLVFRNPTKAFPTIVQDYSLNVKTGLQTLEKLSDSLGATNIDLSVKKQVTELREKLNQDNIRFENVLKSAFFAYNARPCDSGVCSLYLALVKDMADKVIELQKIKSLPDTIARVQAMSSLELNADLKVNSVAAKKLDSFKTVNRIKGRSPASLPPGIDSNLKSFGTRLKLNTTLAAFDKKYFQKEKL